MKSRIRGTANVKSSVSMILALGVLPIAIAGCSYPLEKEAWWKTGASPPARQATFNSCDQQSQMTVKEFDERSGDQIDPATLRKLYELDMPIQDKQAFVACMNARGYQLIRRPMCEPSQTASSGFVAGGAEPLPPAERVVCLSPANPFGYVVR